MSEQSQSVIKKPYNFAVILVVSLALAGLLSASGILKFWDKVLFDLCVNNRVIEGPEKRLSRIVTIDLNDESYEALEEDIDTRRAFTDIVDVLSDYLVSSSIVLDFMFQQSKGQDAAFVDALKFANNTVIAALAIRKDIMDQIYLPDRDMDKIEEERRILADHDLVWKIKEIEKGKIPEAGALLLPNPDILGAARAIGHANMDPDTDGVYRWIPLLYKWEDGYIPSLALAAAVLELRIEDKTNIELKAGEYLALHLPEEKIIRIPIDEQGRMLIPYTETYRKGKQPMDEQGPTLVPSTESGMKEQLPFAFHKVVKAKYDDDVLSELNDLNGRIALLAEVSMSHKDFGPTSFEELYPLSRVHAEVIGGILTGLVEKKAFFRWASLPFKIFTVIILIALAFLFFNVSKDALFHFGFLLTLLAFSGLTLFRWQDAAISPWLAFPVSLLFFLWLCAFLNRLFVRYREQLLLHNALSRYFPHALAERIMREGKTELKPAYKELTILFSDISGFTRWSSDKSPEDVHKFLSDYLESMAKILSDHGGAVDKFMGDGILSFFGDPFEMTNHTEQCVKAALAMQEKIRDLAVKWKPIVDIDLKVRIGINTGKVIVGNLGDKTKIEYTVIGAAVNLAQRMECNAPLGGILVTAAVREKVKDKFKFPERRDVTVKGYGETIEAYVVASGGEN